MDTSFEIDWIRKQLRDAHPEHGTLHARLYHTDVEYLNHELETHGALPANLSTEAAPANATVLTSDRSDWAWLAQLPATGLAAHRAEHWQLGLTHKYWYLLIVWTTHDMHGKIATSELVAYSHFKQQILHDQSLYMQLILEKLWVTANWRKYHLPLVHVAASTHLHQIKLSGCLLDLMHLLVFAEGPPVNAVVFQAAPINSSQTSDALTRFYKAWGYDHDLDNPQMLTREFSQYDLPRLVRTGLALPHAQ